MSTLVNYAFELSYEDKNLFFNEVDELLKLVKTFLDAKKKFTLVCKKSKEKVSKGIQKLCDDLEIQLEIDQSSDSKAVVELVGYIKSAGIGGAQGASYGFAIGKTIEFLKQQMGPEVLEAYIESIIGVDIFIPGLGQVMLATALVHSLISGVAHHLTLRKVKVKIHFFDSNNYQGYMMNFN